MNAKVRNTWWLKTTLFFWNMKIVWVPQGKHKESKINHLDNSSGVVNPPKEFGDEMKSMRLPSKILKSFANDLVVLSTVQ